LEDSYTCESCGSDSIKEDPLAEEIANASLIFAIPFLILFLGLWYILKGDGLWAGIIAFSASSILALGYMFISDTKRKNKIK
jgi:Na+-driven multidrug efflux pump